jgi:hypothetical protein
MTTPHFGQKAIAIQGKTRPNLSAKLHKSFMTAVHRACFKQGNEA